jgi:hypothetical protein
MSFIFIGCGTYLEKKYIYKDQEIPFEWGHVRAKLKGTWRSIGRDDIFGQPYNFSIGVILKEKSDGFAVINNIQLIDLDKKQVVFEHKDDIKEDFFRGGDGYYKVIFLIKKLPLEFNRYKLTVNVAIESDKVKFSDNLEFTLEKEYKEQRKNIFWSFLSGA